MGRAYRVPGGKTSPEELLAASHAACYSMAFSGQLGQNGTPPTRLDVSSEVTFAQVEGGWKVESSQLTVRGEVPGISEEDFQRLAEAAKDGCPISGALKGNVELSVDATLVCSPAGQSSIVSIRRGFATVIVSMSAPVMPA